MYPAAAPPFNMDLMSKKVKLQKDMKTFVNAQSYYFKYVRSIKFDLVRLFAVL